MSDKQPFRLTLEKRHNDPRRVFSFRFKLDDEEHQKARKLLEEWELHYFNETGEDVSMAEIIKDLIIDTEYSRPSPRMDDRRLSNMLLKRMESLEGLVRDIASRDPIIVQGAMSARRDNGDSEIDDDFIGGMFDDFDNTGGR